VQKNEGGGGNLELPHERGCAMPAQTMQPRRLPATTDSSREAMLARHERLQEAGYEIAQIAGHGVEIEPAQLAGSIEGFVGFARIPLGVAGPLKIEGQAAAGDFLVPLATSEGTLVASLQHAFNAMNRCGGARALCSREQVGRAPCFEFASLTEAGEFARWLPTRLASHREITAQSSRYCRLLEIRAAVVANTVYTLFEFSTGDAAGQNMVTAATEAICKRVLLETPVTPRSWLVESMLSGDKRACALPFRAARGRNASAEIVLAARQIERYWRTDADGMVRAWQQAVNGAAQAGTIGLQGNVANAIAALFIACGQDAACVVEATTALTRFERTAAGEIYASVTLPNLIVGTVGGGTYLPTAAECLAMLGCAGAGKASKFAEICAGVALAGELAIVGAMASGNFASAHAAGGRKGAANGNGHDNGKDSSRGNGTADRNGGAA
jgi:hydroxymethylglutaryl-CoA reductase (NADPH)